MPQIKFLLVGMMLSAAVLCVFDLTLIDLQTSELIVASIFVGITVSIQCASALLVNCVTGEYSGVQNEQVLPLGVGMLVSLWLVVVFNLMGTFDGEITDYMMLEVLYVVLLALLFLNQRRIRRRNHRKQVEALFGIHMALSGGYDDWEMSED